MSELKKKYKHYHKDVSHLKYIDVYRVMGLFEVDDACLSHAGKKILCSGQRGVKDKKKDIEEARNSLNRWLEMQQEDENKPTTKPF